MLPNLGWKVFDKQTDQKATHNKIGKGREFTLGEEVLVQKFLRELKQLHYGVHLSCLL